MLKKPTPTKKKTAANQETSGGRRPSACSRIIAAIRRYNRWRRGDKKLKTPCPTRTGKELDAICELAEAQNAALVELAAASRERMRGDGIGSFRWLNAVKAAEAISENVQAMASADPQTPNTQENDH